MTEPIENPQYQILEHQPRKQAECNICRKRMDARGINGHMRKHGIGLVTRRKNKTLSMPKRKDLYLEAYRKGYRDGITDLRKTA
jgi:hypothetical protein